MNNGVFCFSYAECGKVSVGDGVGECRALPAVFQVRPVAELRPVSPFLRHLCVCICNCVYMYISLRFHVLEALRLSSWPPSPQPVWMCMYIPICTHVNIHIHTYTHVLIYTYIHMFIHLYIYIYIYIYIHTDTHLEAEEERKNKFLTVECSMVQHTPLTYGAFRV
jgi:hypothetical protein